MWHIEKSERERERDCVQGGIYRERVIERVIEGGREREIVYRE